MPLRLYNTLSRQVEPLTPIDPAHVSMYTCGPTVYDDAHIGNFRSFLAADLLRRFIESPLCELAGDQAAPKGRRVTHVMNITDVGHMTDDDNADGGAEDKMAVAGRRILEDKKSGKLPEGATVDPANPYDIAGFYMRRFLEDARRLGLKVALEAAADPTLMPRATENIEGMKLVIERLLAGGHAYVAGPPGRRAIYFDVRTFADYGKLSGNTLDALREGAGGRVNEHNQSDKRHPADFLLWKEDAAHVMKWPSPSSQHELGPGYPGWHIECTVMSVARLAGAAHSTGKPLTPAQLAALATPAGRPIIDIHTGGEDNIFPHHECEMAQSCCAFAEGAPGGAGNTRVHGSFAAMWFHPRFLFVEGAKMSKSKGNFFTARTLFAKGYEPGAVRLELIKTHYRSNANFTEQGLKDSQRMIDRWRRFIEQADAVPSAAGDPALRAAARANVAAFLSDDLNIAGAIGEMNAWISAVQAPAKADADLMREFDAVLGVLGLEQAAQARTSIGVFLGCEPDPQVLAKLEERAEAKKAKDFARSDAIRAELAALGYAIKDVAGGQVEVRRA